MIQITQDAITLPISYMFGLTLIMGFIGALLYDVTGFLVNSFIRFFDGPSACSCKFASSYKEEESQ